jgi:hypothetical protein
MLMPIAPIAAAALASLAGIVLLVMAFRGLRLDSHPVCRRCRFDLVGAPEDHSRCPECGSDTRAPGAVRIGNRRRRPRLAVLGMLLLLVGVIPAGLLVYGRATGTNWNPYKPEAWLQFETRSRDHAVFDAAMEELAARIQDGRLSRARTPAIIERGLALQADRSIRWSKGAGACLEAARLRGLMTAEQQARYFRQVVKISIQPASKPIAGSPWMLDHTFEPRIGPNTGLMLFMHRTVQEVSGYSISDPVVMMSLLPITSTGTSLMLDSYGNPEILSVEPGEHTLTLRIRMSIGTRYNEALAHWEEEFVVRATVAAAPDPKPASHIELAPDESLRERMQDAIQIRNLRIEGPGSAVGLSGSGSTFIAHPPADAAFEILWRIGNPDLPGGFHEASMGTMSMTAGMLGSAIFGRLLPEAFVASPPDTVDVVLRPSTAAAAKEGRITRIWNGEIVYRDVPVTRSTAERREPR